MTNLLNVTSQNWGSAKANQLLLDAIYDVFSANRRRGEHLKSDEIKSQIINSGAAGDVIFANFSPANNDIWGELISLIFSYSIQNGIDLAADPSFKKWIEESGSWLNRVIAEGNYNSYWQRPPASYVGLIEAGFITGNSEPELIFKRRYSRNKASYKNVFDVDLLRSIARRSTSGMIAAVEDPQFASNISFQLRGEIFVSLASVGCLTKKAARKIRSDSSEESSEMGIRAIADNITKFKNAAEVLSQVMDTKHYNSATYLARTIPRDYLPFMAVCQNQDVRQIVVNRMQESSNV